MIKGLLGGMALQLFVKGFCPNCKQKKLKQGRVVPMALEIKCSACGALYKKTPFGVHVPEESSFNPKTRTTINYRSEDEPVGEDAIHLLVKGWCPNCLQKKTTLKEVAGMRRWRCSACGTTYRKGAFGVLVREEIDHPVGIDYGEQPSIAGEPSCAPGLPAAEGTESHYRDKDWRDGLGIVMSIGATLLVVLGLLGMALGHMLGWW